MKVGLVAILAMIITVPCAAADGIAERSTLIHGDTFVPTADVVDARSILLDNEPFVAFDLVSAQKLLQMRIDFPKIKLKLAKLEDLVETKDLELGKLTSANASLLDANSFLKTTVADLATKLDSKDAWYRSPYFWYVAGLLTGVGATISIVYAVH